MFPTLFAVHTDSLTTHRHHYDIGDDDIIPDYTTGRVAVFQARVCRTTGGGGGSGSYDPWDDRRHDDCPSISVRVSPYRIHTGGGDDDPSAFVVEGRFGPPSQLAGTRVILYNEAFGPPPPSTAYDDYYIGRGRAAAGPDTSIYRGFWRYSGYTVFSMYCATPIPILVFTDTGRAGPIEWPAPYYNRIRVEAGDRVAVRVWTQRWNPASWMGAIEDAYAEREAARASRHRMRGAAAGGGGAAPAAAPAATPLPKFVADLIIADAVAKGITCPITMEPLQAATTTVTACYHLFNTDALNAWAATAAAETTTATQTVCPQCRKSL